MVSIIIPCYNQAQYLEECLNSVINQTYQDWECIIVNDGSTDNTEEIANNWVNKSNKIKLINKKNEGLCATRNKGIEQSKGTFILALDADDYISNNYVEECIKLFQNDNNLKIAYSKAFFFGKRNEEWILPKKIDINSILTKNNVYCSAIFKKSDWENVGKYDTNMKYGYEDWELWINILKNGGYGLQTPNAIFYYRIKDLSMTTQINHHYSNLMRNYIYNKHFDLYEKLIGNPIHLYLETMELRNYLQHIQNKPLRFLIKRLIGRK